MPKSISVEDYLKTHTQEQLAAATGLHQTYISKILKTYTDCRVVKLHGRLAIQRTIILGQFRQQK